MKITFSNKIYLLITIVFWFKYSQVNAEPSGEVKEQINDQDINFILDECDKMRDEIIAGATQLLNKDFIELEDLQIELQASVNKTNKVIAEAHQSYLRARDAGISKEEYDERAEILDKKILELDDELQKIKGPHNIAMEAKNKRLEELHKLEKEVQKCRQEYSKSNKEYLLKMEDYNKREARCQKILEQRKKYEKEYTLSIDELEQLDKEEMTKKENLIIKLKENIEKQDELSANKQKIIDDKKKQLSNMNKSISENNKTIYNQAKAISEKDKTLSEKDKTLSEKDKTLSEKDKEINKLKQLLLEAEKFKNDTL
jgi:uncharacterized protein (DUF3084 family)